MHSPIRRGALGLVVVSVAFFARPHSFGVTALAARIASAPFTVWTNRYDNNRSGANTQEVVLTPASVGGGSFGLLFSRPVDGQIYAQPLYVPGLSIAGVTRNVVFVATEHNTVFAFDADDPNQANPLWSVSLGAPGPMTPGPQGNVSCSDMFPEVGITSTPVIDTTSGTIFVVAKSVSNGQYAQTLHALDIRSGAERAGGPVAIAATGFDPRIQLNRPGLLLDGGAVYIAFGSHCDDGPYHGWVFAYDATTLQQRGVYNTTPGGQQGGIWQSGIGLSSDGSGVFFVAGNGSFDATGNGARLGLSVGKLQLTTSGLWPVDWWTPPNAQSLDDADLDLTNGAVLVPGTHFILGGGKDGNVYVLDRTNLGHFSAAKQQVAVGGHVHGGPVAWAGPNGLRAYVWAESSPLRAYNMTATALDPTVAAQSSFSSSGHPGGMTTLSANGTSDGIVWGSYGTFGDAWHSLANGALVAFDANDLHTLWSSDANPIRDGVGYFAKFCPPVVANGKVYLATFSNVLRVYGLGAPASIPSVYASDLPATIVANGWGPVERDHSNGEQGPNDGHTITIKGATYAKGLGVHAASDVRFNLGGLYAAFDSDLGVDDETGGAGSVVFQVWLDGVKSYDSGTVRGGEAARHVSLPVSGVKELRLVVADDGDGVALDHADWAGAQLTKTVYVSDLPFAAAPVNGWGPVERNSSNGEQGAGDGRSIAIKGVSYAKGLGVHANSDVRFNLAGKYASFVSDLGVDDETNNAGSVIFQVWLDGTKAYDSGLARGGEAARHVSVSVAGVNELRLVVADDGDGFALDHADWAGAQLQPQSVAVYPSDMTWTSAVNGWGPVERNSSNGEQAAGDGHTITIKGVTYAKGLGVHANSDVRYNLAGLYKTLTSDIGIDDETSGRGSVVFQVWLDGVKAYDSGVVRGGEAARHVSLTLTGAKELRLVVGDDGDGFGFDHADWAGLRIER